MIGAAILRHKCHRLAAIDLAGVGLAVLWWMAAGWRAGFWPLVPALAPMLARQLAGRPLWRSTPLDVPLLLFLVTAAVGLWAAPDRQAAWTKFWLVVGALFLFYALARQPRINLWVAAAGFAVMGALAAAYFLLTHNWQAFPVKFTLVNRVGEWWMAIRPPVSGPQFHPNVMGGLMALLVPYTLACGLLAWRRRELRLLALAAPTAAFTLFAIVLTSSRGAVLSLAVVLALWLLWGLSRRAKPDVPRSRFQVFSLLLIPVALLLVVAFVQSGGPEALVNRLPETSIVTGRLELAGQTVELIEDFSFTGGGLTSFPALYSQYIRLIPFYVLPSGHNVFLDIALEQGIPGALAFASAILGAFWLLVRSASPTVEEPASYALSFLRWAAASSLLVMLLHGLVDDTVYGSKALPLLFVAPGMAVAMNRPAQSSGSEWERGCRRRSGVVAAAACVPVFLLLLVSPSWRAAWTANLGAVRMARVELAQWPTNEWADGSLVDALEPAEALFHHSVSADSANVTARYRLGLIATMRRDYEDAVNHLSVARTVDADHQGIRKALGYSYLWAGQPVDALELLSGLPQIEREMQAYVNWWQVRGREELAERAADMLAQLHQSSNAN